MHISVRGIIKYENGYILIHRRKPQKDGTIRDYYVVPGGKQEENETYEDTVKREVFEELGIDVKPIRVILEYKSDYDDSIQVFMECEYIDGVIGSGDGPEFHSDEYKGEYIIEIQTKDNIPNINLVPEEIKNLFN